jgi:hypothetical protein
MLHCFIIFSGGSRGGFSMRVMMPVGIAEIGPAILRIGWIGSSIANQIGWDCVPTPIDSVGGPFHYDRSIRGPGDGEPEAIG